MRKIYKIIVISAALVCFVIYYSLNYISINTLNIGNKQNKGIENQIKIESLFEGITEIENEANNKTEIRQENSFEIIEEFNTSVSSVTTLNITEQTNMEEEQLNAQIILMEMGIGWNLGNALSSFSLEALSYENSIKEKDEYQLMASYATDPYSGWDASPVPYFSSKDSTCKLVWNINQLNSNNDKNCGYFSFQIINNMLVSSGNNKLILTITKAEFEAENGSVFVLSEMLGVHELTIENKVTPHVHAYIKGFDKLKTSKDIIDGKLVIEAKINEYPMPYKIKEITKEYYYETLWGNTYTTEAIINNIKRAGFGSVRVPVTFINHMDEMGNIDENWLIRIREVVDYVLNNDMYCIINIHHDTAPQGWLKADKSNSGIEDKFKHIWEQIAEYFKGYDYKLLFEGFNEILNNQDQWVLAGENSYNAANRLNQIFVNTVRNTGGNNNERFLIVNTYAASTEEEIIKHFTMPDDSIENRLIAGMHYYGSTIQKNTLLLKKIDQYFIRNGWPVVIGEYGTTFKMNEEERIASAKDLITKAKLKKITIFWWDDGNYQNRPGAQCNYALFDRYSLDWYHPKIIKAIIEASQ